jgi:hypothetical protein
MLAKYALPQQHSTTTTFPTRLQKTTAMVLAGKKAMTNMHCSKRS